MKFSRSDYTNRIVDTEGKIPQDEPCFLLRAQDELAPKLLLMWAMEVRLRGGDPSMAAEAEAHAQEMIDWQRTHRVKTPDMYQDSSYKKQLKESIESDLKTLTPAKITGIMNKVREYYNADPSELIHIFISFDLKSPSFDGSDLSHFNIDPELQVKLSKCKLILYSDRYGKVKIIKQEL